MQLNEKGLGLYEHFYRGSRGCTSAALFLWFNPLKYNYLPAVTLEPLHSDWALHSGVLHISQLKHLEFF